MRLAVSCVASRSCISGPRARMRSESTEATREARLTSSRPSENEPSGSACSMSLSCSSGTMRSTTALGTPLAMAISRGVSRRDVVANACSTARPWAKSGAAALSSCAAGPRLQVFCSSWYTTKRRALSTRSSAYRLDRGMSQCDAMMAAGAGEVRRARNSRTSRARVADDSGTSWPAG